MVCSDDMTGPSFLGLRVLMLESRREREMASLVTSYEGQPITAPSMREIPLESETWAGCVDAVGGPMLSRVTKQLKYRCAAAAVGNAGGVDVPLSIIPFLLRGVSLLGIDSVLQPFDARRKAWARLVRDLDLGVVRVAGLQRSHRVHELRHELVGDRTVHDHPLHRDARLPGLVVAERRDALRRVVQVRPVRTDDGRRVGPQLHHDVLARRGFHQAASPAGALPAWRCRMVENSSMNAS